MGGDATSDIADLTLAVLEYLVILFLIIFVFVVKLIITLFSVVLPSPIFFFSYVAQTFKTISIIVGFMSPSLS